MPKIFKEMHFEIKQVGAESDRTLRFIGSDETADRDNDIIEVAGWQSDNYMKNPVFLWAHNYSIPPIGKCVNLQKDVQNKKLIFDIKFPTVEELSSDVNNPSDHAKFVDTIYNLYKGGYLSATSVGFRGLKYKTRDDDVVLDKPEWQRGRRYIEQELFELSAVPVPANPNALQTAKSKGLIDDAQIKSFQKNFNEDQEVQVYMCDDKKATNLIELARKQAEVIGVTVKNIIVDGLEKEVAVKCDNGESISFNFSLLEEKTGNVSIGINLLNSIIEAKTGARLSGKSKEILESIHKKLSKDMSNSMDECMKMMNDCHTSLRSFIDGCEMPDDEPGNDENPDNEPDDNSGDDQEENGPNKGNKSSSTKDNDDIGLDNIDFKDLKSSVTGTDDIDIDADTLKSLIKETVSEELNKHIK